ncbi:hypothetical protein ABZX65_01550 [Streptomyces sp. NPDC003300]|uniref:hypothetical protein n=1 Tax=unclassified Streptomyces TaxID=2593676 RepID=UPI0033A3F4DA
MHGATWGWRTVQGLYVAVVAVLAVLGAVTGTSLPYLLAVAVTLPFGMAALVLVYGGYALLKGVGGLWASTTNADGDDAAWLSAGSATLNVVLLIAAALANVLLLEYLRRRSPRTARR